MQEYDRSSKWLIEHYGKAMLRLAGVENVISCQALQAEVVQSRQLPDGLLDVRLVDRPDSCLFLLEIATYPDRRVIDQLIRDALLVYLDRRVLPEVVAIVLQPKGNYQVPGSESVTSVLGLARLEIKWHVIQLWTLPAEQLLTADEVGLVPWVPLTQFQEAPEAIFREYRDRIERQAPADERANLFAVIQVLARLRYNQSELLAIFGGSQSMIESPLIQEITDQATAKARQEAIIQFLTARFGLLPKDLAAAVRSITDLGELKSMIDLVARCPDLEVFRSQLKPNHNGS